jgi:hypothetical protein
MGLWGSQKARNEAAKERKAEVIESFGSGMNRTVDVFEDRVETFARNQHVTSSKTLPKAEGSGRSGWKAMSYDTGVEAEVIAGAPGQSPTQRVTVTRLVGLGVFALAAPKKKGGAKPTAILAVANEAGEFIGITFDASKIAEAKMVEIAINKAVERYKADA